LATTVEEAHWQASDMDKKPNKEITVLPGSSSPDRSSARIFISYARKDGARFAADLREKLLRKQLSVWQDIVSLEVTMLYRSTDRLCRCGAPV
jgi:hypothetical protein